MNDQLNKTLNELGLSELLSLFEGQDIDDSVLGDLSDADLKDIGIDKLGTRKKLLAAFGKPGGGDTATASVAEQSAPQRGLGDAPPTTATTPAEATKNSPWFNTLGMPFVPIPRFETRFCIWPVRVQDYESYCMASGAKFPEIPFPQDSDHPIVGVSWNDAIDFCVWLTGKERGEGKIDEKTVYRLATDLEWSAAVGLPHEPEASPAERHLKAPGYPWGLRWPPPRNAGNYEDERKDQLGLISRYESRKERIQNDLDNLSNASVDTTGMTLGAGISTRVQLELEKRHLQSHLDVLNAANMVGKRWQSEWKPVDEHQYTSSVGELGPNPLGISEMGGNVWEWCMEAVQVGGRECRIARGGSFSGSPQKGLFDERKVSLGQIMNGHLKKPPDEQSVFLTIENAKTYRSAYRHIGPESEAISVGQWQALAANEWNEVPCGGFRIVVTNC